MADFTIKAHDRLPVIRAQFMTDDVAPVPIDLSQALSVTFIMKLEDGAIKVNALGDIITPLQGIVEYAWAATDTDTPGDYIAEWEVLWSNDKTQTFPTKTYHTVSVVADLDGD